MKNIGKYLLEKDAHAIIAAFLCALLPLFYLPVGFMAAVIVGLVTLHKGAKAGFWVLAWAALPGIATLTLGYVSAFDVLLLYCMAVWLLALVLRRFHSWGLALELLAMVGIIVVIALHIIFPDLHQWWIAKLTTYAAEIKKASQEIDKASQGKIHFVSPDHIKMVSYFITGLVGFLYAGSAVFKLILAHLWYSVVEDTKQFAKMFLTIRIGRLMALVSVVMLALALIKIPLVMDAFPLAVFPFFVAGLSLVHYFAQNNKQLIGVVIAMYAALVFLMPYTISGLAMIGFVDTWADFRKRLSSSH